MSTNRLIQKLAVLIFVFIPAVAQAQQPTPETKPTPPVSNPKPEEQDRIRIFTEEVVLPIVAYDSYGRFDPSISPDDVLVLEDGIWQTVKSARRIPLNVVLLIDMGSVMVFTQHLDVTRTIAMRVLSKLRPGDQVTLMQFTSRAEVLQDWTDDTAKILKALDPEHGKLLSGSRSRISEGLKATAEKLKGKEAGSTHVVLITDGDDMPGVDYETSMKELRRLQPTLHVLSYTTFAAQEVRKRSVSLFADRGMKRFYKEYDSAIKESERRLATLAENLGGRVFLPASTEEALKQGEDLASEIGATCVLTYTPKRSIELSENTTARRIQVFARRTGLRVRALRTTVMSFDSPYRYSAP